MKSEPREFWIKVSKPGHHPIKRVVCDKKPTYLGAYGDVNFYEVIHVREVIEETSKIGYMGNINGPGCDPDVE